MKNDAISKVLTDIENKNIEIAALKERSRRLFPEREESRNSPGNDQSQSPKM